MARHITDECLALLKQWEGVRLEAYLDSGNVPTIGYGHTRGVRLDQEITQEQAEAFLRDDLIPAERAVNDAVRVRLTDNQFGALVSFVFNVGVGAFNGSTLLKKLNDGDYEAVPGQLMRWVNDNGRKVPGLVNRRAAECGLWARGSLVTSRNIVPNWTKE